MPAALQWLLILAALGVVAWIWWQAGKTVQRVHHSETPPRNPATNPPRPAVNRPAPMAPLTVRTSPPPIVRTEPPVVVPPAPSLPEKYPGPVAITLPPSNPPAPLPGPGPTLPTNAPPVMVQTNVMPPLAPPHPGETNAPSPTGYPRPVEDVFEAQLVLDRLGISCGSMDGHLGPQTRVALRAFQQSQSLPITGELDDATRQRLRLSSAPLTTYRVTHSDLARLQRVSPTWLGKSQQTALDYETILELVAEKGHAHPLLIRHLNPGINWSSVRVGTVLELPDPTREPARKAASITIHLAEKCLEVFDADARMLAHFPCSIAQHVEKRPVGQLHVAVIAPHPNYTFDPAIFPESAEARRIGVKLVLPAGPNNPVGVAWIGLDKPGYGIHGTPKPEEVGRTESHGCFRLANWNAEYLLEFVWVGMPVNVIR